MNEQLIDNILVFEPHKCSCGALDHESNKYRLCPHNIRNKIIPRSIDSCKCGSKSHKRTNYKYCPYNKRFIQNANANQINSIEDLDDVDSQLSIVPE